MKDLYKLAAAFEKISQSPSLDQIRNISEHGPFGGAFPSNPTPAPLSAVDPYIQRSLNNLGYLPEIKVDGILGPETKKALDWFKKNFGLTPTTSPDLVEKQVKNEAAKINKKAPTNQLAFQVSEPAQPTALQEDVKSLNENSSFVAGPKPQAYVTRK